MTVTDAVNDAQSRFDIASAQEIAAHDVNVSAKPCACSPQGAAGAGALAPRSLAAPLSADAEARAKAAQDNNLTWPVRRSPASWPAVRWNAAAPRICRLWMGSHGRSHAGNGSSGLPAKSTTWQVGVQASLPLYQGGGTQSKVREALARFRPAPRTTWKTPGAPRARRRVSPTSA